MRLFSSRYFRRLRRRGHAGQSLVILAIGFLALIGFVGIVTDVSLLFVRFSTLRRAVDAGAVAAAGQMRRVEIDLTSPDEAALAARVAANPAARDSILEGESQARSFANMSLAARQFIEFYGLNPNEVLVEYCNVQRNDAVNAAVVAQQPLCTPDQRKLVRVTAQIDSPTAFFNLFGIRTIRLQASSVSETAVLDLVFIMDVSESMLNQTTSTTWANAGYNRMYVPPVLRYPQTEAEVNASAGLLNTNNALLRENIMPSGSSMGPSWSSPTLGTYGGGSGSMIVPLVYDAATQLNVRTHDLPLNGATQINGGVPRRECQVRYHPASYMTGSITSSVEIANLTSALGGANALATWFGRPGNTDFVNTPLRWQGLVPLYNFYGCCNDPNGDWDFSDAICAPFIQARDASEDFMQRLDFVRGDRVAIVTFDQRATLLDPTPGDNDTRDAFFTSAQEAQSAMRQRVGVRAESTYYANTDVDTLWDGFQTTLRDTTDPTGVRRLVRGWDEVENLAFGGMRDHQARGACQFDDAMMPYPLSNLTIADPGLPGTDNNPPGPTAWRLGAGTTPVALDEVDSLPSWFPSAYTAGRLRQSGATVPSFWGTMRRTYEYQASCRGTNIGEGLALASQTLGRLGRREGAVWIMVLLSDGAAGASSPSVTNASLTAGTGLFVTQPYATSPTTGANQPIAGQYGAYGVCPYGENPTGAQPLTNNPNTAQYYATANRPYAAELTHDNLFPACGDIDPSTRNWCPDSAVPSSAAERNNVGPVRINLDDAASCRAYYDVDDFARDWADFIAVRELNVYAQSIPNPPLRNTSDTLLPTLFTIGFGLNFERQNCGLGYFGAADINQRWACNLEDYLGEELLRYIADAGDNFRIDSDYWQFQLGYRIPNRVTNLTGGASPDWGPVGPCEQTTGLQGSWRPLPPQADCGNYWAVSDQNRRELDQVFGEIAARMFTRLSG